ncbi:tetratricopeptide repeat protein [Thauera chlorobenzoica]|uniref:O-linked N-acetylglucosamine transferase, SPINDLY family protein n=1 Tax=Thauera chlorobenzoica TaxID=96773 RepID=UPI00089FF282|nr:tetratricopeptide repeat protein [Thauera chlorobenzoica]SEG33030.1 Predicted O-linked N-acetylglucosamine transferase, SPINDLY family [Thauera chlorobenzoica]
MSRPSKTVGRPQAQRPPRTKAQTQQVINRAPKRASDWKALGNRLLQEKQYAEAQHALEQARTLDPRDAEALILLGMVEIKLGDIRTAQDLANKSLEIDPNNPDGLCLLGRILYDCGLYDQALGHIEQALALVPGREDALERKALILSKTHRYEEAIALFDGLIRRRPDYFAFWNNAANLLKDIGQLDKAEVYYLKAIELSGSSPLAYSNRLTSLHYNPTVNRERIFGVCKEWETRYAPKDIPPRPQPEERSPQRRLRIGMISDGFSNHPVGRMITLMLESLPRDEFELFAYSTSNFEDSLTRRIKQSVAHWTGISHLTDEQFAERVRSEKIDILIDLAGHNSGNRMRTMALQPAPLLVKWVGGLINTTGLSAIDYLLSDSIESPPGEDEFYTEKLIRLPDDYICFTPPEYVPEIGRLPALNNGYITLGCFNNPTKVNEVVLGEWAKIMHALPGSRLLLKGMQYNSEDLCRKVRTIMAAQGIEPERLMIEGPSPHRELLQTYNRVDIALDPWPYSGGLTTCEAFLMGVPVVSLPGPTFAGRHSATHLVNAGMPELVVDSWDEYRERVLELASDLGSLSTIRHHLREVLLQSPVCDGPRFAKNFTIAMRAIWQRYCEGKQPAALTLNHEGQAWFEGDSEPMQLQHPLPVGGEERGDFNFTFEGKIITLDNGALLVGTTGFGSLQRLGAFAAIAFDPTSKVTNVAQLQAAGELHHYPHVSLGNGGEGTLYACLDPAMSGTLEPLPADQQLPGNQEATQVIAKLPITTLRLDDIEGLDNIDWLLLDNMNDSLMILENGAKALAETLLVQVRVNFSPTHKKQPELTQISHWLARHGFSFYRLNNLQHYSHLPNRADLQKQQATQLTHADGLFIPNVKRMEALSNNQRLKLAFLLNTVYGIKDLTSALLAQVSQTLADAYLTSEHILPRMPEKADDSPLQTSAPSPENNLGISLPEAPCMSTAERVLFAKALKSAKNYFEFGSGGSTVWAINAGLVVHGVESDEKWASALNTRLGERCRIEAVNIGPTGEWGYPLAKHYSTKFPRYSNAIHLHNLSFDLILVDGRFRVACTLSAIQNIVKRNNADEARILIHDFWNRPQYHCVLSFLEVIERAETAGLFKVKKRINHASLEKLLAEYVKNPD